MKALLALLKEKLGDKFTDEVRGLVEEAYESDVTEEVTGLKSKNSELLAKNKELRQQVAAGGGADAVKLANELDELKSRAAEEKATADRELARLKRDLEKAEKLAQTESKAVEALVADNGLTEALTTAGVKAEFMPAVRAMLRANVAVKAEGEKRVALMGDKPLAEAIKAWAEGDEGRAFVQVAPNRGGGAGGGMGGGQGGTKTMKRADFERLAPDAQMEFTVKQGGKVTD